MDAMAHLSNHDLAISLAISIGDFPSRFVRIPQEHPASVDLHLHSGEWWQPEGKKNNRRWKNGNQNIKRGNFYIGNGWLMYVNVLVIG